MIPTVVQDSSPFLQRLTETRERQRFGGWWSKWSSAPNLPSPRLTRGFGLLGLGLGLGLRLGLGLGLWLWLWAYLRYKMRARGSWIGSGSTSPDYPFFK